MRATPARFTRVMWPSAREAQPGARSCARRAVRPRAAASSPRTRDRLPTRAVRATRAARAVRAAATAGLLAPLLAVTLAGCGGGTSADTAAQAGRPEARTALLPAQPAKPPAPTRPCATTDLTVRAADHETQQGLDVERFTLTTDSASGCTLHGAPNLSPKGPLSEQEPDTAVDLAVSQLPVPDSVHLDMTDAVNGPGAAHATPESTATANAAASTEPATIALVPGKTASFYMAWYSTSSIVCVQSNGFGFNAPGDTTYSDMQTILYPIGSLCDGIVYVSPVF